MQWEEETYPEGFTAMIKSSFPNQNPNSLVRDWPQASIPSLSCWINNNFGIYWRFLKYSAEIM